MKLPMPNWLANRIINFAKKRPFHHLDGYMNRFWFIPPSWFGDRVTARVHEILRSDTDRHLHDHPWSYTTIILKGGYTEITHWDSINQAENWAIKEGRQGGMSWNEEMSKWELHLIYTAGCILRRPAGFPHRLVVEEGKTVTTLFIMGAKKNEWGFYTPEGKVYWRDYLHPDDVTKASEAITKAYGARK